MNWAWGPIRVKVLRLVILPALLALHAAPVSGQEETPSSATQEAAPAEPAPAPQETALAEPATPPEEPTSGTATDTVVPPSTSITIPALTRVEIEIQAEIGSNTSKSGDKFPLRLATPLMADGREAIPAGVSGMGEVVHAKKSGAAGAAGELVLAARYLEVDGRRLKLRSLRLVPIGRNFTQAAGAAAQGISFFAFLIKGGQAVVPPGTVVEAKTAEAFTLAAATDSVPDEPPPDEATSQTDSPAEQPPEVLQPTEKGEAKQ